MPDWQLNSVLTSALGPNWRDSFAVWSNKPVAAASIGQVHKAQLKDGRTVAVKIQFPGIRDSINSDLSNLKMLIRASALLPRGLYLENTIKVLQRELVEECDYVREADCGRRMREFLKDDELFVVPQIIEELTANTVLTTEWMEGVPLSRVQNPSQEWRDEVGMLGSCL
jgi:aarF domain-containing kinase